jgi:hypothetical protein
MANCGIERGGTGGCGEFRAEGIPHSLYPPRPRMPQPDSHSSLMDYGAEYVHDSTFCVAVRLPVEPVKPT